MISDNKIKTLQVLRAVAILGILTSHCGATNLGAWGVSVFLILSGFLMMYSYMHRTVSTRLIDRVRFAINKIKKLYPLHVLMMLIAIPFSVYRLLLNGSLKNGILEFISQIAVNLALIQSWIPISEFYFSLNHVAWYLSVVIFTYFVFPIILKKVKNGGGTTLEDY